MSNIEFESVTTRAGDTGKTSLSNGERRFKSELVFDVMGDLDELNSSLGLLKVQILIDKQMEAVAPELTAIQKTLQYIMGIVASPDSATDNALAQKNSQIVLESLNNLETWEKTWLEGLRFEGFIIPGAGMVAALADCSRTICRRAERNLVRYIRESYADRLLESGKFINRLSDYLWVIGRHWAKKVGVSEI